MFIKSDSSKGINYNFENKDICLTECLFIGPIKNPIENNFFNYKLDNIFINNNFKITEGEYLYLINKEKCLLKYFSKLERFNGNYYRKSLDFSEFNLKKDERIFAFFNINSNIDRNIILKIGRSNDFKLWLNNTLIYNKSSIIYNEFYESTGFSDSIFINLKLNKGDNLILIELNKNSQMISLKLSKDKYDNELNVFKDYYESTCLNRIGIIHHTNLCINLDKYEFMIIPKDYINIDLNSELTIKIIFKNNVISIIKSKFYKKNIINILEFKNSDECIMNIEVIYLTKSNINMIHKLKVLLPNYLFLKSNSKGYRNNIINYLDFIKKDIPLEMIPWIISEEYNKIIDLSSITSYLLDTSGIHRIFFTSKLDNTLQNICVFLPEDYSREKSYSIVVHLAPAVSGNFIKFHSQKSYKSNVIFVEISTRGVTQGSYIGEYAILENIKILKEILKLKKYTFNFIGYSTGAFAVWALAENYPDMVNSIVTISGFPYYRNLCNLTNIPILNISGDNDDMIKRSFEEPTNFFKNKNPQYKGLLLKEADHLTIMNTLFSKYVINTLINRNPNEIINVSFRTERMRHNKTKYIEILSYKDYYGKIDIEFYNEQININIKNITSFIFYVPSNFKNKKFDIYIINNNIKQKFTIKDTDKLLFKYFKNRFILIDEEVLEVNLIDNIKGMGLLDIYMDSIKILFRNTTNDEVRKSMYKVAKTMSNLKTMGYNPNVNVNYKIECIDYFHKDNYCNDNIILINEGENNFFEEIIHKLPIKPYCNGFYYNDEFIEGDYCILFITKNPYNDKKKLLIIYSTKYELFNSNYFLRNFIIPSYSNGLNQWLNGDALIYKDKEYIVINSIGCPIKFK